MKKTILLTAAMAFASAATMQAIYNRPEFVEEEWNYIGTGTVDPGYADCFLYAPDGTKNEGGTTEWQETLPTKVWEKKSTPGDYYIEYVTDEIPEGKSWLVPDPFYVHAQDHDKIWSEPICWLGPGMFEWYHLVPEVMGKFSGDEKYYAKMGEDRVIRFPALCFMLTLPDGQRYSNLMGTFALGIPVEAAIQEITDNPTEVHFYDLNGIEVAYPSNGIYVKKQGTKTCKVYVH